MKISFHWLVVIALAPFLNAGEVKQFFPTSDRGSDKTISSFEAEWYSKNLRLMKEDSLYARHGEKEAEIYRFTLLPTWGEPRCVAIERNKNELIIIRHSRLDGDGFFEGQLVEKEKDELNGKTFDKFTDLFNKIEFPNQTTNDPMLGLDGSQWILERLKNGEYHIVVRWTADEYEPKKRGTEAFVNLCKWMLDNAPREQ